MRIPIPCHPYLSYMLIVRRAMPPMMPDKKHADMHSASQIRWLCCQDLHEAQSTSLPLMLTIGLCMT